MISFLLIHLPKHGDGKGYTADLKYIEACAKQMQSFQKRIK